MIWYNIVFILEPVHTDTTNTSLIITYPGSKVDVSEDRIVVKL